MGDISLALAEALVQSALTATAEKFKRPVCVAVVDSAGFLVAFVRQDSTPLRSIAISQGPIDLDFDRPSTHWRDTIGLQGKCIDRHILDFGEFQSSWIEHNVQLTYHVHS